MNPPVPLKAPELDVLFAIAPKYSEPRPTPSAAKQNHIN